ncbi:hypothetical protein BZG36_03004 [Bifiguratus adelaidae]|uniref:HSF-type DNA-binding domain-containing protein n=1 Tax=Bifiguratus adelaidae TaxID=1938954 RepID=A0A261XZM2_9FUNG|nr:hypothetical protein BZG36_03004 [Bifiguratus adelaidae]
MSYYITPTPPEGAPSVGSGRDGRHSMYESPSTSVASVGAKVSPYLARMSRNYDTWGQEKLGFVEDITELPQEYEKMEAEVDALKNTIMSLLRITQCVQSQGYDNPFAYSETISDYSQTAYKTLHNLRSNARQNSQKSQGPKTVYQPKTLSHTLSLACMNGSEEWGIETPFGSALFKTGAIQAHVGEARLAMDAEIDNNVNQRLELFLKADMGNVDALRKAVNMARLELDSWKQKYRQAKNSERIEFCREQVEKAESNLLQKVELAVRAMKEIRSRPEPIQALSNLTIAQMQYFKDAASLLNDLMPELEQLVAQEESILPGAKRILLLVLLLFILVVWMAEDDEAMNFDVGMAFPLDRRLNFAEETMETWQPEETWMGTDELSSPVDGRDDFFQMPLAMPGGQTFAKKLFDLLSVLEYAHILSWNDQGNKFSISDEEEFAQEILPLHFKGCKYSSFVRQLNIYGFVRESDARKTKNKRNAKASMWQHPQFLRGREDLIMLVKRKSSTPVQKPKINTSGRAIEKTMMTPTSITSNDELHDDLDTTMMSLHQTKIGGISDTFLRNATTADEKYETLALHIQQLRAQNEQLTKTQDLLVTKVNAASEEIKRQQEELRQLHNIIARLLNIPCSQSSSPEFFNVTPPPSYLNPSVSHMQSAYAALDLHSDPSSPLPQLTPMVPFQTPVAPIMQGSNSTSTWVNSPHTARRLSRSENWPSHPRTGVGTFRKGSPSMTFNPHRHHRSSGIGKMQTDMDLNWYKQPR